MSIVPKDSVRFQVAVAVLVTITLSWVLSTGLANYLNYLNVQTLRQHMLAHPNAFPYPIPEPRFGWQDFLLGRPPRSAEHSIVAPAQSAPPLRPDSPERSNQPPPQLARPAIPPAALDQPRAVAPRPDRAASSPPLVFSPVELKWVMMRLVIALGLAVLAAMWIGRRLTKPLSELADGARAFHNRNLDYRVPIKGKSEFTAVATAMNDMAEEVSAHIGKLEDDAQRRRQFLADIAHELRSPITTIKTMACALQDGVAEEPERKERAVSALVRTSERMSRLVHDVMELAKLDLDRLPLNKSQVDLRSLTASAIVAHEAEAASSGIMLESMETAPPVIASVDADKMTQVLDNIIGNAISYAGPGALVRADILDGNPIMIRISDTGVGIPAKDLPHVLDSFYRVNSARTPGENHIGLGLSLTSRMIEAHGGELKISSEEGKGTEVTILIPKG